MKDKKEKGAKASKTIKVADAVAAYNLLNQAKEQGKQGIKLSALDTADIFKVLYAVKALKPIASGYADFEKDVRKQFEPENWDERRGKFNELSDEGKLALNKEFVEYENKVRECLSKELESDKEVEAYERLDKEAFGKLIKDNGHIEDAAIAGVLMEVLV